MWRCEADPVSQHPLSRGTHGLRCRSDLSSFDAFDSASYCRQRFWLFVAYVVSFGSIIGAVTLLLGHMHDGSIPAEPYEKWIGWVRIFHYILQYEYEDSKDNLARTGIGEAHVAVPHSWSHVAHVAMPRCLHWSCECGCRCQVFLYHAVVSAVCPKVQIEKLNCKLL